MTKAFFLASLCAAAVSIASPLQAQTIVCVKTNFDSFCMQMLESQAPKAVANFLQYVDSGAYNSTLIHNSVRNSYLLGGNWQASLDPVPVATNAPVAYEASVANDPGTVALVTTPGQPNSATSGWRINVGNNAASFNQGNSGAVFARILSNDLSDGLAVVQHMSRLSVHALNDSNLAQAPMLQLDNKVTVDDLVQVQKIYRYGGTLDDFNTYGVDLPADAPPPPVLTDVVCMDTTSGTLCMQLFPEDAPKTVANFLSYVNAGAYDGSVFHRFIPGFVLQGGGYTLSTGVPVAIPATNGPVVNEFKRSNTLGTIAMAKLDGDANSATTQWFFNLVDNSADLDATNGGFTVFGEIIPRDLPLLEAIGTYSNSTDLSASYGSIFTTTPIDVTGSVLTINKAYETQIDLNAPLPSPYTGPLANVVAMSNYGPLYGSNGGVTVPVRLGGKLYSVVINQHPAVTDPNDSSIIVSFDPNKYYVDLTRIIQLQDNGRIAATFDGQFLTIPTIRLGNNVFANVVLQMLDQETPQNLNFEVVGFEAI